MSSLSDSLDGGSFESNYGSQVEQRTGHLLNTEEENYLLSQGPLHSRRISEARESTDSSFSIRQSIRGRATSPGPNPNRTWLSFWRRPWRPLGVIFYRNTRHGHLGSQPPWWRSASHVPISPETPMQSRLARALFRARIQLASSVAALLTSKRRKTWFLALIALSLSLTILSAGYLLGRLHHPSDIFTSGQQPGDSKQDLLIPEPVDSGSGSRRNRNRGKGKNTGPWSKDPSGDRLKDQPDSETIPGSDRGKVVGVGSGDSSVGGNKDISNLQICNLNDLVHGHWVYSESIRKTIVGSQGSNPAGDQSWTGYGPLGCRSHIWNERYLLTPNVNSLTSAYSTPPQLTRASLLNQNRNYATHMQSFSWVLDHGQSENGQIDQKTSRCQQPEMDVGDFIEVLKRSPLIMVGDKFLEQEFLSLECMVMGLQDQLLKNYRTEHQIKGTDNESVDWKIMDYHIESEMPPTVELKIAPGRDAAVFATQQKSKQSPQSSSPVPKVPSSNIYRKAKPGQMKLVDMKSNLTLATFIRSDVLWDAGMFSPQTTDHEALHPDCKLVGPVLMCEPPPQLPNTKSPSGSGAPTRKGSWFSWWIGEQDQQGSTKGKAGKGESQNMDESAEFWVGSDLERDMINLEWVDMLRQIVDAEGEASKDSRGSRTPLMVISNGIFWSYDPLDALLLDETFRLRQQHGPKRLTKVERDQALKLQDTRRKLLRRRYTTVLSHTLEFLKATYPELRVIIQTSVRRHQDCPTSRSTKSSAAETVVRDDRDQEDALLNELTRVVVARMQDSRFSFLDTTFLRLFNDTSNLSRRYCHRFMMPGPLDTLVHQLYGELFRLDL